MSKKILINNRIYCNVEKYCNDNDLKISSYIENAVSDKINTDLYGDLNKIIKNKTEVKISKFELDIKNKLLYLWIRISTLENDVKCCIHMDALSNFNEALKEWSTVDKVQINDIVPDEIKCDSNIKKRKLKTI